MFARTTRSPLLFQRVRTQIKTSVITTSFRITSPFLTQTLTMSTTTDAPQITPESLTTTLKAKLKIAPTHIAIHDQSGGCGQAFSALIVSSEFESKGALARHRLVNAALKEEISAIHAWTPRCLTPAQWAKEKEMEAEEGVGS